MEAIFHEQQEGALCAQHCLNSLLQGQFYSAVDLSELAIELDTMERARMAEVGEDSPEYQRFIQQPSANMDDSGFFSVQVISRALAVWALELVPLKSSNPEAVRAKNSAISATAYICNYREHWFTIRRLGSQWFNLNSLLEGPELVSNTYLGEFLAQLQQEGYDIFIVTGNLPECDADLILQAVPAIQAAPPRLLGSAGGRAGTTEGRAAGRSHREVGSSNALGDEEAELEAAMLLSLAETSGSTPGQPASIDSDELARMVAMHRGNPEMHDQELEDAIKLSTAPPEVSEEDELQQAIAMSLSGGGAQAVGVPQVAQAAAGWGQRLANQELEEERRYKEQQEKEQREEEEELQKALAMSIEGGMDVDQPAKTKPAADTTPKVDPVQVGWPKFKNPPPGSISSQGPSKSTSQQSPDGKLAKPSKDQIIKPSSSQSLQSAAGPSDQNKTSPASEMPTGAGHTLGGGSTSQGGRFVRTRPGNEPPSEDPAEIRRRRLAFLDNLQKSPPKEEK